MTQSHWQTDFRLPENPTSPPKGTLASGASPDAQFIFDAIYAHSERVYVLTTMQVNDEWGFIEHEKRQYFATLPDLQAAIADFMNAPTTHFETEN
ncbi:hypothetical protein [Alysiella filiformis]|uniref:Uncharacterized protein n=1 Tax=Alysiella filiformis DSM 16848 TaxID=1120981 RepID=A0A286E283_9NEIS|nr:hypothetical protein [Alysiella filiformis]QMT30863.1 hypothetical protein H3L97_09005 [Alysiella filiformis]UBQ56152.1 hypothetical protein JF568_11465 [Alysiella filiformis DSM 16848]SOD65001.1 hypothetical protein SAMN02746062_00151 [Alysiella filiformis DSM 16848]